MMVDVFTTGRFEGVEMIVDGGYLDHQGLGGQPLRGPSGFETVVSAARGGFESLEVIVEDLVESEDQAVARLRWKGVRRSGESEDRETIEWIRVRGEVAVEHWGGSS